MGRTKTSRWLCALIGLVLTYPIQAQTSQTVTPDYVESGTNHIVTNLPGNFNLGTNVNNLIGANRFYNAGITGQGTITANVEAGHAWNGHESLAHVSQFAHDAAAFGTTTNDLFDRHATWASSHIGGRLTAVNSGPWQMGIAPGTDLRSGAIAAVWGGSAYALSFNFSTASFNGGYAPYFGTADVINSSWGGTSPAGNNFFAQALDGFAAQNSRTTLVASAGNSGPVNNSVGFPGSGYNAITVAALNNGGNNSYNTVASFSSRGPQDYFDPVNGTIVGARAAVDIAAPGTNLHAAFYGGQTGGNNTTLAGSFSEGTNPNFYTFSVQGTSFAAPIVAGGVSLLKSASYNTPELASNAASRDTLVVKSVLMNSADKTIGWNNGQVANGQGGVNTTQALDFAAGAGAMNLNRAFDQYLTAGTRDVLGLANGNLGTVSAIGWDLGNVLLGGNNLYTIGGLLEGGSLFNVSLNWFRNRTYNLSTATDVGQADLTLEVTDLLSNTVISRSSSLFNTAEHLSFLLPNTSQYGVRVLY
ncbi:MAG: S8 family serine peptidase, partial [Pirellulaceae bacterium]|nr:S8 family serine peptidase [Pirellulaceae bacterium]